MGMFEVAVNVDAFICQVLSDPKANYELVWPAVDLA